MANGSGGIGLGGVAAAFGGDRSAPNAVMFEGAEDLLRRSRGVSNDVLRNLRSSLPGFYSGFERGTEQQRGLQGEQADVLRTLLSRSLGRDPQQQLRETGNTLFSFINPNILDPIATGNANRFRVQALARGFNPAAVDSTAGRAQRMREAQRTYLDVARDIYAQIPNVYNQIRNAGVTDEMIAAGYIPQIQAGYRNIDLAPLVPLREATSLARGALAIPADFGAASRANTYGYHQPTNIWDRAGDASRAVSNTIQQAADIYSSLYGGGMMGGGGGGMFGGGAGGGGGRLPPASAPYWNQPQAIA